MDMVKNYIFIHLLQDLKDIIKMEKEMEKEKNIIIEVI